MRLAAIDIGSNAIRLQIVKAYRDKELISFKKLEFLRFPLRLGKDVFLNGKISSPTDLKLIKLMKTFRLLIDLYEVTDYYAVATSAMREASNANEIKSLVLKEAQIEIDIISGEKEAHILNLSLIHI